MELRLLYIIFSTIFISVVAGNNWRCDYTYVKKANGYFKFHRIPLNWFDARKRCQHEGAVLASPYPPEVYESMVHFMNEVNNVSFSIFTGIHSTFYAGDYHTLDGTPLDKIPIEWMNLEPDNKDNKENCLILSSEGNAADVSCDKTYPYICFKKKEEDNNIILNPCGTNDLEYIQSNVTGNCYKFHTIPDTWHHASLVCSAEGGHLAIINSNDEAKLIKDLFARYPSNKMVGPFVKDVAHVGFYDWGHHGDWRTIHDETIKEAGYSTFNPGKPSNQPPGEYCGCVFRSALLCDVNCDNVLLPFFCEKTPGSLICDQDK